MKGTDYFTRIMCLLKRIHHSHPSYTMGQHFATALNEMGDLWGLTDKEVFTALNEYAGEFEAFRIPDKDDVDTIINDGLCLAKLREGLLIDEEEDGQDNE